MRDINPRNLGVVSTQQKPVINVAARVTPKIKKPVIPLWFLNDAYNAKVKAAVKTATVRAGQAGDMVDRAFTSALHRSPTQFEMSGVKVAAERMAADGKSMAEIARFIEQKTNALPESLALRDGIKLLESVTQQQLGRDATPRECAGIREFVRDLYNQHKPAAEVYSALTAKIQSEPEYRKLHAGDQVNAQFAAVLQRAPSQAELDANIASVRTMIDQGKSAAEIDGALAGALRGTMEFSERFGLMRALADNSWGVEAEMPGSGWCAAAVERTIERTMGFPVWGDAHDLDSNLPGTGRFQQVNMSLAEALQHPGLVLVWEQSAASQAGLTYGHTAITTGDGISSNSDYHEADTLSTGGYRYGLTVWMPIG